MIGDDHLEQRGSCKDDEELLSPTGVSLGSSHQDERTLSDEPAGSCLDEADDDFELRDSGSDSEDLQPQADVSISVMRD